MRQRIESMGWTDVRPKPRKGKPRTDHYNDPLIERFCPFCGRSLELALSETSGGKVHDCECGAVFCAMSAPQWTHDSPVKHRIVDKEKATFWLRTRK